MSPIELNKRQEEILQIVKGNGPITGEQIADRLSLTRSTLRPDLAILTMAGFLDARPRVGYFYSGKKPGQDVTDTMNNMKVKDFQSIPVVVREDVSVYDAISQMFLDDVGTLFVVDKKSYLSGVLSRKDLLRASLGSQNLTSIPVHIIMTRMPNITYCAKNESLIQAAHRLINQQIDALPVVEEQPDGFKVVGRLTKTNITRAFLSLSENHDL
ncbi:MULTISPECIES: helix-turn-helix transcriptional regulator [Planococcus]|uniref:Transcriptional repressor CcpN n=2 Tax=Planococcus TaxID=1372 RepID=A0ABM5WX30_9BACL|nr:MULTISPECIES: helix-turn-helix transcriptional regulator [Planococcus]ALS78898.1 transcriptional repressor CcpN [Planococcus kocurii]AQU79145.1 transcriptional repressor CcpN [Planococcus faecalis]KAA0957763.1 helix-turn-helix transcriptional regulator [Planococcus sp. ANT_H30]MDJ0331088.1 helix-turn-helix transcriptional regulator [Planococcus sp. S3-L1]OHX51770.1 transcriptional repressor CcpN [Planococcus faecalis]